MNLANCNRYSLIGMKFLSIMCIIYKNYKPNISSKMVAFIFSQFQITKILAAVIFRFLKVFTNMA